ncbi:hypothetical protein BK655_12500 [Pseudomonas brassicacearum]|uniref:hypothetical protein n=1 Tax=Pseudomonas brassicacearum TaxID=930166 RepID=UPI000FEDDF64|nr:hypothetical protein [Pseudomonas brassicacearum]ROM84162.1 hypothetical protein BK655_12500 [Pseudomonas brassicacearum]
MPAENKIAPNIQAALDYSRSFATAKPNIGLTEKEHIEGLANLLERTATENLALQEELERQKRYVEINADSAQGKHLEGLRYRDERNALQELLNQRDEQLHDLEQRRHAEQQACQAAERRVEELQSKLTKARDSLNTLQSAVFLTLDNSGDADDPGDITIMKHDFDKLCVLVPEDWQGMGNQSAPTVKPEDWHMHPCKKGHRDVGAAGGIAHCYQCDEKIEAATTQEAFKRWNETHPAEQPAPVEVMPPEQCRQRIAAEGKPHPKSSCAVCGKFSPKWRECDALIEAARLNPIKP